MSLPRLLNKTTPGAAPRFNASSLYQQGEESTAPKEEDPAFRPHGQLHQRHRSVRNRACAAKWGKDEPKGQHSEHTLQCRPSRILSLHFRHYRQAKDAFFSAVVDMCRMTAGMASCGPGSGYGMRS